LTPFLEIEDDGSFKMSKKLHKIIVDLEKDFNGRMLINLEMKFYILFLKQLQKMFL